MHKTSTPKVIAIVWGLLISCSVHLSAQYYPGGLSNTSLIVWLDANDATTFTLVGGKVSQWNDKSGTGVNISQATAADRPVYTTNQINGMPIVQTDGSTTFLGGTYNVDGLTQMSMLAVATPSTITSDLTNPYSVNYPIFYWGMETAGWGQVGLNLNNAATTTFYNYGWRFGTGQASADVFYNPAATPSGAKVMAAAHLNTVEKGYYNGFNIITPAAGSLTSKLSTLANSPTTFYVGHGQTPYGGNGYGGNNKIGEITIYNVNLGNTQLIILQNYLASKWGVTLLANQHYTPPTANSFFYNLIGAGRESSSDTVNFTYSNDGMGFNIGHTGTDFLKDNGDYIMAAHSYPLTQGYATINLPATVVQTWADEWNVQKTDVSSNGGNLNIFFSATGYGVGGTFGTAANYKLLYRATTGATTYSIVTATASVAGSVVNFLVSATNISNGYYTLGTTNTSTSPLPIELTNFNAECNNNKVAINWATASETNNDYFNIEKSNDAVSFNSIAKITGAGTTSVSHNYSYTDAGANAGEAYYRLKQTDFNGHTTTFNTISTECEQAANAIVSRYNSQTGSITIDIASDMAANYTVQLYDVLGKRIFSRQFFADKGTTNYSIDVSSIHSGIYFLSVENGSDRTTKKLIISR